MARTELFVRKQAGGAFAIAGVDRHPGSILFVCSVNGTDSAGRGQNPDAPLATIDYAIGLTTASKGDVIYVLPGHAESISGAAAIAADVAGISIIGIGNGANRPTITLHTAPTTIAVSAANVTLKNLRIKTDVDAVVTCISVTAAGCTIDAVDFVETAACAALQFILTTAAATDMTVQNCRWIQTQTAATALQQWIVLTGADRAVIRNNFANLKGYATANPANGVVVGATTACNDVLLDGNVFISTNSTGAIVISLLANTTGFVRNNSVASGKTAIAGQVACANCYASNNYANNTVNLSGLLDPVVDS
jgi:hypothetical protein